MTDSLHEPLKVTDPGFVFIDKPSGWTSHDVVAKARRTLGTRKIGHAGTLDPLATGLLILGVNRATRLLGYISGADKRYESLIQLGVATHSDDADGDVVSTTDASHITRHDVDRVLGAMVGVIEQRPSAVSAIKVDGKRAHARVRAGEDVELPSREVTIHELDVLEFVPGEQPLVRIAVHCSSGTYIRAIARDLGSELSVGGHVRELRRTAISVHDLSGSQPLEDFLTAPRLTPIETVARAAFESLDLNTAEAGEVRFGRPLSDRRFTSSETGAVFAPDGTFLALYANAATGIKPVAVFV